MTERKPELFPQWSLRKDDGTQSRSGKYKANNVLSKVSFLREKQSENEGLSQPFTFGGGLSSQQFVFKSEKNSLASLSQSKTSLPSEPQEQKLNRIYEEAYRKMERCLFQSYKESNYESEIDKAGLISSCVLKSSMKNIKAFDIMGICLLDNGKNLKKNKNKKESKVVSNETKYKFGLEYLRKLEQKKPNVYNLISFRTPKQGAPLSIVNEMISAEYCHEMVESGFRFNKVYGENRGPDTLAYQQDYLKQKTLNQRFIKNQKKQITLQPVKDVRSIGELLVEVRRVLVGKFCQSIQSLLPLDESNPFQKRKRKIMNYPFDLNSKLSLAVLSFSGAIETVLKCNQNNFISEIEKQMKRKEKEIAQSYKAFEPALSTFLSSVKEQQMLSFKNSINEYLKSVESPVYPLCLTEEQFDAFESYKQEIHNKMKEKRQQGMAAKISGTMIYEIEERISEIKDRKQTWTKVAWKIIQSRARMKTEPSNSMMIANEPNRQKIRKINLNEHHFSKPYSIYPKPVVNNMKSRVSIREQKKEELNNYINKLSGNSLNKSIALNNERLSNSQAFQSIHQRGSNSKNKYYKYSKYPIKFGNDLEFVSEKPEDCSIVYNVEDINIKELTLKFMRDRRRFGVNRVLVRVAAGKVDRDEERKAMRVMQVLTCLGANVKLQSIKPYRMIQQKESIVVETVTFVLRENIQQIWSLFDKT